jgi:hypothetical protein
VRSLLVPLVAVSLFAVFLIVVLLPVLSRLSDLSAVLG